MRIKPHFFNWTWGESNPWPHACHACALTNWATGPKNVKVVPGWLKLLYGLSENWTHISAMRMRRTSHCTISPIKLLTKFPIYPKFVHNCLDIFYSLANISYLICPNLPCHFIITLISLRQGFALTFSLLEVAQLFNNKTLKILYPGKPIALERNRTSI